MKCQLSLWGLKRCQGEVKERYDPRKGRTFTICQRHVDQLNKLRRKNKVEELRDV